MKVFETHCWSIIKKGGLVKLQLFFSWNLYIYIKQSLFSPAPPKKSPVYKFLFLAPAPAPSKKIWLSVPYSRFQGFLPTSALARSKKSRLRLLEKYLKKNIGSCSGFLILARLNTVYKTYIFIHKFSYRMLMTLKL